MKVKLKSLKLRYVVFTYSLNIVWYIIGCVKRKEGVQAVFFSVTFYSDLLILILRSSKCLFEVLKSHYLNILNTILELLFNTYAYKIYVYKLYYN